MQRNDEILSPAGLGWEAAQGPQDYADYQPAADPPVEWPGPEKRYYGGGRRSVLGEGRGEPLYTVLSHLIQD
jgi:hypothetical protein